MPRAVRAGFVQHQARIVVDENVGIRGIEVRTMQDTTPARAVRCIAICGTLGVAVKRVLAMAGLGLHAGEWRLFGCAGGTRRSLDSVDWARRAGCAWRFFDWACWAWSLGWTASAASVAT